MTRLTLVPLPSFDSIGAALDHVATLGDVINVKLLHGPDGCIRGVALLIEKCDIGPNDANLKNAAIERSDT